MAFFLGIDGGGTKTKFLLGNEQNILAEATTGGSNILRTGEAAVRDALHEGIDTVCATAQIVPDVVTNVVAGVAGSSNEEVRVALAGILGERFKTEPFIVGDMVIAHHAALQGGPGVLINAGTGSIAYGKNARNETARAGGWGFAISDEGSGHWIGRLAIATAMRCHDRKLDTGFVHHLVSALQAKRPEELAMFANSTANPDFAQVFPAVVDIAQLGDTTAQSILQSAGEELANLAFAVVEQLFAPDDAVAVAASGGVFQNCSTVLDSFSASLQAKHSPVAIALSAADPALGALMLAREPR